MTAQQLYLYLKNLLLEVYTGEHQIPKKLLTTLALLLTGLFLGRHVQLWNIALWAPIACQLPSVVRRFERWMANGHVDSAKFFKPFVLAMHASLGHEVAYLLIDCTQAGRKCRTLFIGLAYHGTVLPIVWRTVKGHKGHVTGALHQTLLQEVYPYFRDHHQVIVLGDAEFSNEHVIRWLQQVRWDFVLRFRGSFKFQPPASTEWQSVKARCAALDVQPGQRCRWANVSFTETHRFPHLHVTVEWAVDEPQPLYLVSSLAARAYPERLYEMRYWVETLFGNHKSRGFQLTRTHMTDPEHIDRLMLALAIATCLILGLGTHLILSGATKQVDWADRRDLSLFQLGWRWFFRLLALERLNEFTMVFNWSFTLPPPGPQPAT